MNMLKARIFLLMIFCYKVILSFASLVFSLRRFMNLPELEELGSLNTAFLSLRNLESLVFDLSGCGQVSLEVRTELQQSIRSLKWLRGSSLDLWINIEGLPSRRCGLRFCPTTFQWLYFWCSCVFRWLQQVGVGYELTEDTETEDTETEDTETEDTETEDTETEETEDTETELRSVGEQRMDILDETRPFPCSHLTCTSFHAELHGYCERHRWLGLAKRIFVQLNTGRQYIELSLLILMQAAAEVESRHLLLLIIISLLPAACFSMSQSTGGPGTVAFLLIVFLTLGSVAYTAARLQRMHDLSKELHVQVESMYAKHLQIDMSRLFGGKDGDIDIVQPRISSLTEHFIEARVQLDKFNRDICLPLQEFLRTRDFTSRPNMRPALKLLAPAQEDVLLQGSASHILDLLYCDVTFSCWHGMIEAWKFLTRRIESGELNNIEIVHVRDYFAAAETGRRCAEMILNINGYLATVRFLDERLTQVENQLDNVHRLAKQLGLATHLTEPLLVSRPKLRAHHVSRQSTQFRPLRVAVSTLQAVSSLAAMYLALQYFMRYSPPFVRSNLPKLINDAFALETVDSHQPRAQIRSSGCWRSERSGSDSDSGWFENSLLLLPSMLFSLPYLALTIVLLSDLCRSQRQKRKVKPIQLLYEKYCGIQGTFFPFKVATLQFFTVMLQALGKLQIMGGIVSLSFHSSGKHHVAPFQRCFWAFVGFLFLNSIYPTVLFVFPSENWARVGAAVLDAVFDVAYTGTYLIMTVLATYELGLDQDISGNFGDQAAVNFRATLDPSFAFPTDFFGFFAVFYSLAHVCTVCRAVERRPQPQQDPRHPRSTPQSWRPTRRCCKVL